MALKKVRVVINGYETVLKLDPDGAEYRRLQEEGAIRGGSTQKAATATTKKRTAKNK